MVIMSTNDSHILFLMPYFVKFHIISPLMKQKAQWVYSFISHIISPEGLRTSDSKLKDNTKRASLSRLKTCIAK